MAQDPYVELGVPRTAAAGEIRKAFHKLAKKYHPDVKPGDKAAEEKFKRVSAAFDLLGDEDKRKKFDAGEIDADGRETMRAYAGGPFGGGGFDRGGFSAGGFGAEGAQFRTHGFENIDLEEVLGGMFGRGAGGARGGFPSRGADVRARLDVDLEEAILGGKKRVSFLDGRTLDVTIPKGVEEGRVLRLKGQGQSGPAGPGDALVEIVIRPHPIFRREGDSLAMDVPVTVYDAVLGGRVEAQTPDGRVTLNVPRGSNSGAVLRLKGRGLARPGGGRGDLLARLVVTLPEAPDAALESVAETWRTERPYTARRRGG